MAGSPGRRAAEAAIHSPFQPEGEKLFGEGDGARRETSGGLSGGAKRLRRSRWERGTRERVARGGVRPGAGAGGYTTKIRLDASMVAQKADNRKASRIIKERKPNTCLPVGKMRREVWGMWTENRKGD